MTRTPCSEPVALATLVAYWLGELDGQAETRLEEHLLGCGACSTELQDLVALAGGIRGAVRHGRLGAVVARAFPARLAATGLRVREYRLTHNGSVNCTIAPDDDVVVACLEVPLAGVERLDVILSAVADQDEVRLENVPFDAPANEIVVAPDTAGLRGLPRATQRIQLVAVEHGADRLLGEYTFHHAPWISAAS